MAKQCSQCKHFELSETPGVGECRFNPPTISERFLKEFKGGDYRSTIECATVFPIICDESWCGKWEEK